MEDTKVADEGGQIQNVTNEIFTITKSENPNLNFLNSCIFIKENEEKFFFVDFYQRCRVEIPFASFEFTNTKTLLCEKYSINPDILDDEIFKP